MSRNAFSRLDREYNEREDRLDEARALLSQWNRNLQDTPSAGPLIDSDFGYLDATPVPPPAVRCTPKKRRLLSRAWRSVQRATLRWRIDVDETYIRQCERDGILGTRSMRNFRDNVARLRVQLALLED